VYSCTVRGRKVRYKCFAENDIAKSLKGGE
jgi:hypothetical protein